jgi:hypothetical protein
MADRRPGLTVLGVGVVAVGTADTLLARNLPSAAPRMVDSVGHLDGSTAVVAVLTHGDVVSASVCDAEAAVGERFTGTLLGERAVLHSPGGAELTVDLGDGGAAGTFTPMGAPTPRAFRTFPGTARRCVVKDSASGHIT